MTLEGLRTERLLLRRWGEDDRPVFHRLNSDEAVMAFFGFRRTRAEADAAMDLWNESLDRTGLQFLAAERLADGAVVGMIGLGGVEGAGYPFAPTVQIGWRLVPEAQGLGLASEGPAPASPMRSSASPCPRWSPTAWSRTAPRRP